VRAVVSGDEREESDEAPYGAGVAPLDLEAPIDAPGEDLPDESAAEAEKRRRSTITRLSETSSGSRWTT
jgi:hypothetical protein